MLSKPKTWITGSSWKAKDKHSLENLKLIYNLLYKHQNVTESNKDNLVETLRVLPEILAWGEKHDSMVLDFFMEKNMLAFFLRYMKQKNGHYISLQMLQSLNLIFQNINNNPFIYYLLSNNHVNSIILHKFDFSNEEVMAYYITFLKLLSFKLNESTIHFFYNEHVNDFALYTEAIKFFNHSESMVRITVRTITLNVYRACQYTKQTECGPIRVRDVSMLKYIRERTASPYFSNLVWYMGSHALDIDIAVREDTDHKNRNMINSMIDEHVDYLLYVNDILNLNIEDLNSILEEQLLGNMLLPLHIYGIINNGPQPKLCSPLALFLLSLFYTFVQRPKFLSVITQILVGKDLPPVSSFVQPPLLQDTLSHGSSSTSSVVRRGNSTFYAGSFSSEPDDDDEIERAVEGKADEESTDDSVKDEENITDEQKLKRTSALLNHRVFFSTILETLNCTDNDFNCLLSLMLLHGIADNIDSLQMEFQLLLLDKLVLVVNMSCENGSRLRLITLELATTLIHKLQDAMQPHQKTALLTAKEQATLILANFYQVWVKSEEIFIEIFEDEFVNMKKVSTTEDVSREAAVLLPPTATPLTGIDFKLRLPCGEVERARRAIRVFLLVRDIVKKLNKEEEMDLPLTKNDNIVNEGDVLDLNNSDLIACTITNKNKKERRFVSIDEVRMIIVEPDGTRLGFGIVRSFAPLQRLDVTSDRNDNRILYVKIPNSKFDVKLELDDHIRCMAAKQRLTKARARVRSYKMESIAKLIDYKIPQNNFPIGTKHPTPSKRSGIVRRVIGNADQGEEAVEADVPIVSNPLTVPIAKMTVKKEDNE
ncbi:DgyrCDS5755 [Dimorphilus gyrociliatus]|uniref:DgyrCDS5755 n=1 Tax=Dimorphilus gyrociliatus TaxID=2664684 RepID=A0A7I8VQN7_9ANNE|nr:DgyrCDS5755 [Dimorphilus gyrociliatus]